MPPLNIIMEFATLSYSFCPGSWVKNVMPGWWFSRSRGGKVDAFGARLLIGQFLLKLGHIKINSLPELGSFTTISWYFKYYVSDCLMYDVKSDSLGASQAITLLFKSCL